MPEMADYRAVWAALESGRQITIDHVELAGEMEPDDARYCLNFLIRHGYVDMCGTKRAASGECLPTFKSIRWTGPEAPHPDKSGKLVDPNVAAGGNEHRGLFKAQVRLAAEKARGCFTLKEFRRFVELQTRRPLPKGKKFDSIWAQLKRSGEIVRVQSSEPELAGTWEYRPNPHAERIRAYHKAHLGQPFTFTELKAACDITNSAILRQALELLTAEGYRVHIDAATPTSRTHSEATYTVDAPEVRNGQ